MKKRLIAMFLAVTMIIPILPTYVFAANGRFAAPERQETDDEPSSIREWLDQNREAEDESEAAENSPEASGRRFVDSDGNGKNWRERLKELSTPHAEMPDLEALELGPRYLLPSGTEGNKPVEAEGAEDETPIRADTSGKAGDNVTWRYSAYDRTLTLDGTGPMYDFEPYAAPWNYYRTSIRYVSCISTSTITSIGNNAFLDCYNLRTFTFRASFVSIGEAAFSGCGSLTSLSLPDGVSTIGSKAFQGCGMSSVVLPAALTEMNADAFQNCWSLTEFDISSDNEYFAAVDGVLYTKDMSTLLLCPSGKSGTLTVPASVMTLGPLCFANSGLEEITLPEGLTAIGAGAFDSAWAMSELTIPTSVTQIGAEAFSNCESLCDLAVAPGNSSYAAVDGVLYTVSMDTLLCYPAGKSGSFVIPASVTSIGASAFRGSGLMSVQIPDSVTVIGAYAFSQTNLQEIRLPDSVEALQDAVFQNCNNLRLATLGSGLECIGAYAFADTGLLEITIPAGVDAFGEAAFYYCDALSEVFFEGPPPTVIGENVFFQCEQLSCLYVRQEYLTAWDPDGDGSWNNIAVAVGASELPLADRAGENVSWSFNAETGVLTITGSGAMDDFLETDAPWRIYKSEIREVLLTEGITSVGARAFYKHRGIQTVCLADSITAIGAKAFYGCSALEFALLPSGLNSIGDVAFANCLGEQAFSVVFLGAPPASFGQGVFQNTTYSVSYLPEYEESWEDFNGYEYDLMDVNPVMARLGDRVFMESGGKLSPKPNVEQRTDRKGSDGSYVFGFGDIWDFDAGTSNAVFGGLSFSHGITGIGSFAFCDSPYSYYGARLIEIPEGVMRIGDFAFFGMSSLQAVRIPASVTAIGDGALGISAHLEEIALNEDNQSFTLVDGVLYSADGARLLRCTALEAEQYAIPAGVTRVDSGAFDNAVISLLRVPASVTNLGSFCSADSLRAPMILPIGAFEVDPGNPAYASVDGLLCNKSGSLLLRCPGGMAGAITLPASVTAVGGGAFLGCSAVTAVNGLNQLQTLGAFALAGSGVSAVTLPVGLTAIPAGLFYNCQALETLAIPAGVDAIGPQAFGGSGLSSVTFLGPKPGDCAEDAFGGDDYQIQPIIYYLTQYADSWAPDGETEWNGLVLQALGSDLCGPEVHWFYSDGQLSIFGAGDMDSFCEGGELLTQPWENYAEDINSVSIGEGVTGLGDGAFASLPNLSAVSLPDSLIRIGARVFEGCAALGSVTLPEALEQIGACAFSGCGFTAVRIPASVDTLGDAAFSGCSALDRAFFAGDAPAQAGDAIFENCAEDFFIAAGPEHAQSWAPNGETLWHGWPLVFFDSSFLCGDTLSWSFHESTGLLTISGRGEMYDYDDGANPAPWRSYAAQITALALPAELTGIGSYAFADCTALNAAVLPNAVRKLGAYAFRGCAALVTADLSASIRSIPNGAFLDCGSLESVTIPNEVVLIGEDAFRQCASLASVELPKALIYLQRSAFRGCSLLQEVTIGPNIREILYYAFQDCSSLSRAMFEGPPPISYDANLFDGCAAGFTIYYNQDYASVWAPAGETAWRGYPILPFAGNDISSSAIRLTRLFYTAATHGEYEIHPRIGSHDTYAYLYSRSAYRHSDSFTAVFYRADDPDFTQNVREIGRVSTDRLSEYASVEDAIFDLELKCLLPADTLESYYVRAEYSNLWGDETHSAATNAVYVVVEDTSWEQDFLFDQDTGRITGYRGAEETAVFPYEIDGVAVTALDFLNGASTQNYNNWTQRHFHAMVIPDSVTTIANYCFTGERYLGEITFPDSVLSIGDYAFWNNTRVKRVCFGAGRIAEDEYDPIHFGRGAFSGMEQLELVDMSKVRDIISSVSTAGEWNSFLRCPNLKRLILPETGEARLVLHSFLDSEALLEVENGEHLSVSEGNPATNEETYYEQFVPAPVFALIHDGVSQGEVDENFVYYYDRIKDGYTIATLRRDICDSTGTMEFPSSFNGKPVLKIGADVESIGYLYEWGRKYNHIKPRRIVIPQGVRQIGDNAFRDMSEETVELPLSLQSIGDYAFYFSESYLEVPLLSSVNLNHTSLTHIGDSAFQNQKLVEFGDLDFLDGISIGKQAFEVNYKNDEERLGSLNSITVHGTMIAGPAAFRGRESLRSLTVTGALHLGQDAFDRCYWLESVSYSGQITDGGKLDENRGFSHFRYTPAAPEVVETEPITVNDVKRFRVYCRVGDYAYIKYKQAVAYTDPNSGAESWMPGDDLEEGTLVMYLNLEEGNIILPAEINDTLFKTVNLTNILRFIEGRHSYTLQLNDGIQQIGISLKPDSQNPYILTGMLKDCTGVRFPEGITEIPGLLFWNGKIAGTVEIPGSVKKIGFNAFAACQIDTLILHEGLQEIGEAAFSSGDVNFSYDPSILTLDDNDDNMEDTDIKELISYDDISLEQYNELGADEASQVNRIIVAEREDAEDQIQLPDSLKTIKGYAFAQDAFSGTLSLSAKVTTLGDGAFYETGVTELSVSSALGILGGSKISGTPYGMDVYSIGVFNKCPLTKVDLFDAEIGSLGIWALNNGIRCQRRLNEESFESASHPMTELKLPRRLKTVDLNALAGVDPTLLQLASGLEKFYIEYPTVSLNGRPVSEYSLTLPDTVTAIHASVFQLGTVTFYNRDPALAVKQLKLAFSHDSVTWNSIYIVEEELPAEIPESCLIRCYEGSFIHSWCVENGLRYALIPEPPTTLAIEAYGDDGRIFTDEDFSRIDWVDETEGCYLRFDSLNCPVHEFKADHVYSVRLWLTQENYLEYDLEPGFTIRFDPASGDFEQTVPLRLYRRSAVEIVGSFGQQAQLAGFELRVWSRKNNTSADSETQEIEYPVTLNPDGSFSVQVPATEVQLTADVAEHEPFLPLTLKNVAYMPKTGAGRIDLGVLSLPAEQILEKLPLTHKVSGVVHVASEDGSKYAECGIFCTEDRYFLDLTNLRADFAIGETVVIQVCNSLSETGFAPYTLVLPGEKSIPQPVTLTPAQNAVVIMPARLYSIKLGAYNEFGRLTGHLTTGGEYNNRLCISAGSYTLVAFQNNSGRVVSLPDTLAEFQSANNELAGYALETVTLEAGQEYEFSSAIPSLVVKSAVTVSFTENARLADRETGSYPVYLHYSVSNEARNGEITFRLQTLGNDADPFCETELGWAFLSGGEGTMFEASHTDVWQDRSLEFLTDAYEGTICFYVRPTGQALKLLINGEYKTLYTIPGTSFSVSTPPSTVVTRAGALTLNYTNAVKATAKVYVNDVEVSATALNMGTAAKARLEYMLPEADRDTIYQLCVKVFDPDDRELWSSFEFQVMLSTKPAPVPQLMNIRVSNGNASEDGIPRVTNSSFNFTTGEYQKIKLLVLTENYNSDGTMAKDVEFSYYLNVLNPELVAYGEIYLKVWCNETEPRIYPVTLSWNENTGTFDGSLLFPANARSVGDLPFGFDLEIPTEKTLQEVNQEAIDEANAFGSLLSTELDPETEEFYQTRINVDDFRMILENGEYIDGLTEEEKQAFRSLTEENIQALVNLAEQKNEIADIYAVMTEELPGKMQEAMSGLMADDLNAYFAANEISAQQTVPPEGTTAGMLLSDGYQEYTTDYGVFYVKTEEEKTTVTCLDPPYTLTFAKNSHILNGLRDAKLDREEGVLGSLYQFRLSQFAWYKKVEIAYNKVGDVFCQVVSAIDIYLEHGLVELAKRIDNYQEALKAVYKSISEDVVRLTMDSLVREAGQSLKFKNGLPPLKFHSRDANLLNYLDDAVYKEHMDRMQRALFRLRNAMVEAMKAGPSKLPVSLKAIRKITSAPGLIKAVRVIPMLGGIMGLVISATDLLELYMQEYQTVKALTDECPLDKWEAIYSYRLFSNGWCTVAGNEVKSVSAVRVGSPGDALRVTAADVLKDFSVYYAAAAAPVKSFHDVSDMMYEEEDSFVAAMENYYKMYDNYFSLRKGILWANFGASAIGLVPHAYTSAFSLAVSVGIKLGETISAKILDETPEDWLAETEKLKDEYYEILNGLLERMVNAAVSTVLNLENMMQIRQGYVSSWYITKWKWRKNVPSIVARNLTGMSIGFLDTVEIEEYVALMQQGFETDKWMETLDNLSYDFSGKVYEIPGDEEEPEHCTGTDPQMDPSGYVYEAVASNRIEGATAKLYYLDKQGSEQYWGEAAEYEEVNPQTTDSFGEYGWMTPIGKWKVYVEKEGYLRADSSDDPAAVDGWLPVPPPQLNVNIGLVSTAAPEITSAAAAADRLQITFSQYMSIADLEADPGLITVVENGEAVPLAFTFADREENPTQEGVFYGRVLTITRTDGEAFTGNGLNLHVSAAFQNYAGTPMAADFEAQSIHVDQIVGSITHEYSNGYVGTVGEYTPVTVTVLDTLGNPVAGETVTMSAAYGDLYQVESYTVVTDENGVAHFSVMANHDGTERFTFTTPNGVSAVVTAALKPLVTPHVHSSVFHPAAEPTCTEPGHVEYWSCIDLDCESYEKYYADEEMSVEIETVETAPALGHDYVNGICSRCGEPHPDFQPLPFTDIPQNAYYYEPVRWAVENGITSGTSDSSFSPNQVCTRAQIVTFLWRAAGSPVPTIEELSFPDVPQTAYYYNAVRWAVENGITGGVSETSFCPNRACTRSEAVTFLWRAAGSPVPTQTEMPFSDVPGDTWYTTPVLWAAENNITAGTSDATFSPKQRCTRAQIVTFLWRARHRQDPQRHLAMMPPAVGFSGPSMQHS